MVQLHMMILLITDWHGEEELTEETVKMSFKSSGSGCRWANSSSSAQVSTDLFTLETNRTETVSSYKKICPSETGGNGTILYLWVGSVITLGSALWLIVRNKLYRKFQWRKRWKSESLKEWDTSKIRKREWGKRIGDYNEKIKQLVMAVLVFVLAFFGQLPVVSADDLPISGWYINRPYLQLESDALGTSTKPQYSYQWDGLRIWDSGKEDLERHGW